MLIQEDVEHGPDGEVGAVTDEINPGGVPPSLQERVHPRPQSQLRSLHDLGFPVQFHPKGTYQVTRAVRMAPSLAPNHPE